MFLPRPGRAPALLTLLGVAALGAAPAHAFLTYSASITTAAPSVGLFSYTYQFTLNPNSSPLSELDVPLGGGAVGAPLTFISMPTGFTNSYVPGAAGIAFVSSSPSFDIKPGGSATFVLNSPAGPATQAVTLRTDDGSGPSTLRVDAPGPLAPPPAVPEPSALALLALGLLPLGLRAARRRKHGA